MRCWHCGNVFTPATTATTPVEVSCPSCKANLGVYTPPKETPVTKPKGPPRLPAAALDPEPPPPPPDARRSTAGVAILICGVVFLLIAGVMALQSHEIATTYERAQGSLIRKEFVRTGRSVTCIGTIAFTASNGLTYHAEIGGARYMKLGEPVKVLYRKDNPNDNRADATSALWGFPLAFGGIGCVLMVVWMLAPGPGPMYLSNRRRRRNDEEGY